MSPSPKVVAVTGASGYIGTRLLMQLETNPNIGKIVAFDQRPLPYPIHNISFYQRDILSANLRESLRRNEEDAGELVPWNDSDSIAPLLRLHGVNTLVHLACAYSHTDVYQDWAHEARENLQLLEWVHKACVAAQVNHEVFLSSHRVYGTHAGNPVPVNESAPLLGDPRDKLGYACFEADEVFRGYMGEQAKVAGESRVAITILRACPVLGYSDDHFRAEHVFPSRFLGTGANPPFQFLHEVDLARLLEQVIQHGYEGIYNVAGEGVVFLDELAEITRRKLTQLPYFLAYPAARVSARMGKGGLGNWNLNTSRYPIIMSTGKIKQTLNYRFDYTSMEALNAFVNYNGL